MRLPVGDVYPSLAKHFLRIGRAWTIAFRHVSAGRLFVALLPISGRQQHFNFCLFEIGSFFNHLSHVAPEDMCCHQRLLITVATWDTRMRAHSEVSTFAK